MNSSELRVLLSDFPDDSSSYGMAWKQTVFVYGLMHVLQQAFGVLAIMGLAVILAMSPARVFGQEGLRMNIVRPVQETASMNIDQPDREAEPFVKRVGAVVFDVDQFMPRSPVTGERTTTTASFQQRPLALDFFPDRSFAVTVDAESRPQPEVLTLSARREGDAIATLSITVTAESYLMTFQDLDTATVYRVVGNTETGVGQVTEIDLRSMPPILYSPPIIPSER